MNIASHQPLDAALFDLDGTLIDSRSDITTSVNWVLARQGWPTHTEQTIGQFVGDGMKELLIRSLGTSDEERLRETVRLFRQHYRAHCLDATTLYPGVRGVLEAWRGKPLAVVTNKPHDVTLVILEGLGVAHYFRAVLGGESAAEQKPHPAPILSALNTLQVAPARSVMIGDHANDIRAGQAAHTLTCAVTYGLGHADELRALSPNVVIDDCAALLDHFV